MMAGMPAHKLVWWLTLVMGMGVTAVVPILPLYARAHGIDVMTLGWLVAAYLAANLLAAYPAGWLSDVIGRRALMGIGLAGYGLASLGLMFTADPLAMGTLRAIEGVAGACFLPAAIAYIGDNAPPGQHAERLANLGIAQNMGLLLGPVFGGLAANAWGLAAPFGLLAGASFAGALLLLGVPASGSGAVAPKPEAPATPPATAPADVADKSGLQGVLVWLVAGLALRALCTGIASGLYETVWPIYMSDLGADTWTIGMSWTLFAVPSLLLARPVARAINRYGGGPVAIGAGVLSTVATVAYAATSRIDLLLVWCVVDGIAYACTAPAVMVLAFRAASAATRGRVMGAIGTTATLGTLVGALWMPVLYVRLPALSFYLASGAILTSVFALGLCLAVSARHRSPSGGVL